jgi:AAA domain
MRLAHRRKGEDHGSQGARAERKRDAHLRENRQADPVLFDGRHARDLAQGLEGCSGFAERLSIGNFRGFDNFVLEVGGRSLFLIGENGGGKSSLLTAIVRALGRDLNFTRADFRDVNQPIELEVTLSEFTTPQRGLYGNYIQFGPPATLTVGARAIWNARRAEILGSATAPRSGTPPSAARSRPRSPLATTPGRRVEYHPRGGFFHRVFAGRAMADPADEGLPEDWFGPDGHARVRAG